MLSLFKSVVPAIAALGLVFGISVMAPTARAADDKAVGTLTGTIVDKDGKAVDGAKIRVMKPMQRGQGGPGGQGGRGGRRGGAGGAQAQAADEKPGQGGGAGGAGGAGGQRPAPVAEGTSDKDGKFSIANVPAGEYMVVAMVEGKGFARGRVTVKAGESASVELKLQDRPAGQGRGQGPGGAGGRGQGGRRGQRQAQ